MKRLVMLILLVPILGISLAFGATPKVTLDAVEKALANEPKIGSYKIQAVYDNGLVTLKGQVSSEEAMYNALQTTRKAHGVTGVRNRLTVNPMLSSQQMMARPRILDDRTVANSLMSKMENEVRLSNDFSIYVYGGEATFRGTAANHKEIDRILSIALMTDGVTGIKNEMTIKGKKY